MNTTTTMSKHTFERRVRELQEQIDKHPFKDEVVFLATEQLLDAVC